MGKSVAPALPLIRAESDPWALPVGTDVSERYDLPAGSARVEMHPHTRDLKTVHVIQQDIGHRYLPDAKALESVGGSIVPGGLLDAGPDRGAKPSGSTAPGRRVILTPLSEIKVRRAKWLWNERIAVGTLSLVAGREGIGKSTVVIEQAARITRGELPGEYFGSPRAVFICATEDSFEHTIVPRIMAHGADLSKVYRVEIMVDSIHSGLSLPVDNHALERAIEDKCAALLILDPLMSRLSDGLDTHKDGEVRKALEPLVAIADRTGMAVVGLIHHNKSGSTDPLTVVMGSKAFTAVARSVHTVIVDPDDETEARRFFGTAKNNLGRTDLPTLTFTIKGHHIEIDDDPEGTWVGRVVWGEDAEGTISDAIRRSVDSGEDRSATSEAAGWLEDHLASRGGTDKSADIKKAGHAAGHSESTLKRAKSRLRLETSTAGFPRISYWALPGTQIADVVQLEDAS